MAARKIDARYSTLIGTPDQLKKFINALAGDGAALIDMRGSNIVPLEKPMSTEEVRFALRVVPSKGPPPP